MPLIRSGSRSAISTNIREMQAADHPHDQAVAAALSNARRYGRAEGGMAPSRRVRDAFAMMPQQEDVPLPRSDPRNMPPDFGNDQGPGSDMPGMVDMPMSRYPSKDDAAFARRYDFGYGDPNSEYINNQKLRLLRPGGDPNTSPLPALETHPQRLRQIEGGRDIMDEYYARAALAVKRSPLAALGFDPNRTAADIERDPKFVNIAGTYTPKSDEMYANAQLPSSIVHESIHRGIQKLKDTPFWQPKFAEILRSQNEPSVRYLMAKRMGDPEFEEGATGVGAQQRQSAIDKFTKNLGSERLSKLLDEMEKAAAMAIAYRRPRGPRALGGRTGYAAGGSPVMPWTERAAARGLVHAGAIKSPVPGRTDQLPIGVGGGAYVLPADHVAHIGQGNTDAGTNALDKMFSMGKFGAPKSTKPRMPRFGLRRRMFAEGGAPGKVDIVAAGGEYVIPPEVVQELGGGDMDVGHKILDKWVLSTRKDHINTLRKLKPPKKS